MMEARRALDDDMPRTKNWWEIVIPNLRFSARVRGIHCVIIVRRQPICIYSAGQVFSGNGMNRPSTAVKSTQKLEYKNKPRRTRGFFKV